jgi:Domain of unknown function (DUF4326)
MSGATSEYRGESDTLGDFLSEYVVEDAEANVLAADLFKAYSERFHGKWSQTTFGRNVGERYKKNKLRADPNRGKTVYEGIRFRTEKDGENENVVPVGTSGNLSSETPTRLQDQCFDWYQPVPRTNVSPPSPQPTTVVNLKFDEFSDGNGRDVQIDRQTKWGNPFIIGKDGDRSEVVEKYREWVVQQPELMDSITELRGKRLGCHCSPALCHGDVLAELADGAPTTVPTTQVCHSTAARSNYDRR